MPRFKMYRGGSSSSFSKNSQGSSETRGNNNNNNVTKRGRLMAGLFRRKKKETTDKPEETSRSLSLFSSRSTLSVSMSSNGRSGLAVPGGEDLWAQRLSAVRGTSMTQSRFCKSETLQEVPFEESEHSSGVLVEASPPTTAAPPLRQRATDDTQEVERTSMETQESSTSSSWAQEMLAANAPQTPPYVLELNAEHPELGYLPRDPFTDMAEACDYAQSVNNRPIFCLSTETPGDEDLAQEIFSHPLLVEAITSLFVLVVQRVAPPATLRRTRSGRRCRAEVSLMEATTLESLLASPLWGDSLTRQSLARAMKEALEKLDKPVPKYLQLLQQQGEKQQNIVWGTREPAKAEVECANVPGVVAAKSCLWNHQRVCVVTYDPRRSSYSALLRFALQHSLCDSVYHRGNEERVASRIEFSRFSETRTSTLPSVLPLDFEDGELQEDSLSSKQALRKTAMRVVPLTGLQSIMANQLIHQGRFNEAMKLLSPWQGQILMKGMRNTASFHDVTNVPIQVAWCSVCQQKSPSSLLLENRPIPEESDPDDISREDENDAQFGL